MPTTEEIDRFIREATRRAQRGDRASRAALPGGVATALQGLTFGMGDEITAGVRSLFGPTSYSDALDEERANVARYREERPVLATGLEVAGSLPTLLIPGLGVAGQAARGAAGASRFAQAAGAGARAGATAGALQGFGEGEGGLLPRLGGAVVGAGVGGALGGAAGAGIEAATPAVRALGQRIEDTRDPAGAAGRMLARVVERDQPEQGAATRAVEASAAEAVERQRAGLPNTGTTLAEALGPNARATMEGLAQQPGEAMTAVTGQLTARQGGRMDRILAGLQEVFGDADDAYTRRQALYEQRSQDAGPLFDAIRAAEIPLDDVGMSLWRRAQPANADAQTLSVLRGRGRVGNEMVTVSDLLASKEGLDQLIERELRQTGRGSPVSVEARRLRDAIVAHIDDATRQPDGTSLYQQARALWAGPSAHIDATDRGANLFQMDPAETRAWLRTATDTERDHFVKGGMNALQQALAVVRQTGSQNPVNAIFANQRQRDAVRVLTEALNIPPEDAVRRFGLLSRYLGAENAGVQTENAVMRNSATARRSAVMGELAAPGVGATLGGTASYLTTGDFGPGAVVGGALAAGGAGARYITRGVTERRNDALARLLATTDPLQQQQAARRVEDFLAAQAAMRGGINPMLAARAGALTGSSVPAADLRRGLLD